MGASFKKLISLFFLTATALQGCSGRKNSLKSALGPLKSMPPATGGKIIPPSPVAGSYLTAELVEKDGVPLADARV
ncbi:MAG: hypothetical protein RIR26_687, partial [Pseudomonadota bacterium]